MLRWCWSYVYCDNCKVLSGLLVAFWFGLFWCMELRERVCSIGVRENSCLGMVSSLSLMAADLTPNDGCAE